MLYADVTQALAILSLNYDAFNTYTFIKNPDFTNFLPRVIEYAEQRIYREVVPLATRAQTFSGATVVTAGVRKLSLALFNPQPIVLEGIALITPLAAGSPSAGVRWNYRQTTLDFIDMAWPKESVTMSPAVADPELYWAPLDAANIVLMPTPDQAYLCEGTGIFQPTPLSAGNPSTYLTLVYPALFLNACMISVSAFMRDYGAQSDDPKVALSWEGEYGKLLKSTIEEEQRRRGLGQGSGNQPPAPEASSPRGVEASGTPSPGARVPF